jgi:hypothetical protein
MPPMIRASRAGVDQYVPLACRPPRTTLGVGALLSEYDYLLQGTKSSWRARGSTLTLLFVGSRF